MKQTKPIKLLWLIREGATAEELCNSLKMTRNSLTATICNLRKAGHKIKTIRTMEHETPVYTLTM